MESNYLPSARQSLYNSRSNQMKYEWAFLIGSNSFMFGYQAIDPFYKSESEGIIH